jgi:hypothetical protein
VGVQLSRLLKSGSWSRYFLPRQADVLFVAIFTGVLILGPRLMNMDGDLGRHLTIGNYILEQHTIPTRDIFSHTMSGVELTPHEWLAQVLFALSFRLAGLDGVVLLCALVLAATFTLVFMQSVKRSRFLLVSLGITILASAAASVHWLARPHLFTMLLTVLWINELEKWRENANWHWWIFPLLMVLWVNLHGAFIVGILIWLFYLGDAFLSVKPSLIDQDEVENSSEKRGNRARRIRQMLLIGVVVVGATLINPVGWQVWDTTFGFLGNQYLVSHTVEYQSPDFQLVSFWPFLLMICMSIFLFSFSRKNIRLVDVMLITAWTAFSLISARNIAIYAVISAPILAEITASIIRQFTPNSPLVNHEKRLFLLDRNLKGKFWLLVFVLVFGLSAILNGTLLISVKENKFSERVFPVQAADWLSSQPGNEPIFNYFPWGGYLLYRHWPDLKVFIDGQTDFYGEELTREYENIITLADGWQEVLEKYQVSRVLMPVDSELIEELKKSNRWKMVYQDGTAAVLDLEP